MGKKSKKGGTRNHKKQKRVQDTVPPVKPQKAKGSGGSGVCPCCGIKLNTDNGLPGLMYCAGCDLFFGHSIEREGVNPSLETVFNAIAEVSHKDILFSDRIAGLVSALLPSTDEGSLRVLRQLSAPESQDFVENLRKDNVLSDITVTIFVNKSGLDRQKTLKVCNALRSVLGKKPAEEDGLDYKSTYILNFSSSETEIVPGEQVTLHWHTVDADGLRCIMICNGKSEEVKPKGSRRLTVSGRQEVTLKLLYKGRQEVESRSIVIKEMSLPVIHSLLCSLTLPVMESEKLEICWDIENADKITLVHRYSDYERLSVDVTDCNGKFVFTAMRTEMIDIIAERRSAKTVKSIMIEVMPLPRFKISAIPKLTNCMDMEIARIPQITDLSGRGKLMETLREISSLSELTPYSSLKESVSGLSRLVGRMLRQMI